MNNEANSVRKNVRTLVEEFPELGDNYKKLITAYWTIFDNCKVISDIENATSAETIRRNYQKLVEQGKLPVSSRTKQMRENARTNYKKVILGE